MVQHAEDNPLDVRAHGAVMGMAPCSSDAQQLSDHLVHAAAATRYLPRIMYATRLVKVVQLTTDYKLFWICIEYPIGRGGGEKDQYPTKQSRAPES